MLTLALFSVLAVGLVQLVVVIAVVGLLVWLITTYIPMPPVFKTVIYIICAIVLILWLLRAFGAYDIQV